VLPALKLVYWQAQYKGYIKKGEIILLGEAIRDLATIEQTHATGQEWQDISTAPRDGKDMIVACEDGSWGNDSLIETGRGIQDLSKAKLGDDEGEGWEWYHQSDSRRTHWFRPTPPTATHDAEKE
jgi:hypothetical protein